MASTRILFQLILWATLSNSILAIYLDGGVNRYVEEGQRLIQHCLYKGHVASIFSWSFTPCDEPDVCDEDQMIWFKEEEDYRSAQLDYHPSDHPNDTAESRTISQLSWLEFNATQSGIVTCHAQNSEGKFFVNAEISVGDFAGFEPVAIWRDGFDPVIKGDNITLTCAVPSFKYTDKLIWWNGKPLEDVQNIRTESTPLSHRSHLHLTSIPEEGLKFYECQAFLRDDSYTWQIIHLDFQNTADGGVRKPYERFKTIGVEGDGNKTVPDPTNESVLTIEQVSTTESVSTTEPVSPTESVSTTEPFLIIDLLSTPEEDPRDELVSSSESVSTEDPAVPAASVVPDDLPFGV